MIDREKELRILLSHQVYFKVAYGLDKLTKAVLALFPDTEQLDAMLVEVRGTAKEQERERIWAWGHLMCGIYEHTNIPIPKEMGGGMIKKENRRRRRCIECWNTL